MRQQHYFMPTLRDNPADAETASHRLMLRAGLIRQLAAGVYTYLPLGQRVLRKVQNIIREEMDKTGAQEMLLPTLHPAELWKRSGRWDDYGQELMRLKDRHDREFALGPTHEEAVTALFGNEVKSYKKLPVTVYQIQTKFRDERRPRFGVLRSREFVMKDAYSFDASPEGLNDSYRKMYEAYTAILTRCGLRFKAVEADSGTIGGTGTHEFIVPSDIGEDTIVCCDSCGYAANIEKAEVAPAPYDAAAEHAGQPAEKVHTPGARTIDEVARYLNVPQRQIIKSVAFRADGQTVLALVRGDYEINEAKLKSVLGAGHLEMLPESAIVNEFGSAPGFIGPVGAGPSVKIVADYSVRGMNGAVCGANEPDFHWVNAVPERDFHAEYGDLRQIAAGDCCPRCSDEITFTKGIEVGHIFKLGTKYSEAMGAVFLDENGQARPMIMGCYGIGISRMIAAIIEQNHDADGIVWPAAVAPFHIHLIAVHLQDKVQREAAERLYHLLREQGYEVLYDDRDERPGVKFKDADLIGLPLRITVGKKAADNVVEISVRGTGERFEVPEKELWKLIRRYVEPYDCK